MTVPQILTLNEVAGFLGVGTPAVAAWARDGLLPACARSEGGELLFYRWRVEWRRFVINLRMISSGKRWRCW